ncbi:MAG: hypothetical protein ACK5HU_00750 [Flavobacteriales bacterium]
MILTVTTSLSYITKKNFVFWHIDCASYTSRVFTFHSIILFILLASSTLIGQELKNIQGQIIIDIEGENPENIEVLNLNTQHFVLADHIGNFEIKARIHDTLQFKSIFFEQRKYIINQLAFDSRKIFIHLNIDVNKIEEVVINGLSFTGNLKKDVKKNRPLLRSYKNEKFKEALGYPTLNFEPERKYTKKLLPEIAVIPIPLGLDIDALGKLITGEYRKVKEYREERFRNDLLDKVEHYYSDFFFTTFLKIPKDEVKNFVHYAYYFSGMETLVKQNRFETLREQLIKLAPNYKKRLNQYQLLDDSKY